MLEINVEINIYAAKTSFLMFGTLCLTYSLVSVTVYFGQKRSFVWQTLNKFKVKCVRIVHC